MPYTDLDGCAIYYEFRAGGHGPAVLFANSLGTGTDLWSDQVAALGRDRAILRYDMRGHGRSQPNPAAPTIDALVDEALAVMDAAQVERVDFVGISLGGLLGQKLALRCPERVRSLALCATSYAFKPTQMWLERAARVRREGLAPMVEASRGRWFTPGVLERRSEQAERLLSALAGVDPESYAQCCEILAETDLEADLPAMKPPTLLIAGEEDKATPPAALQAIKQRLDGARLLEISGAAHLINVNQPRQFNEALLTFWHHVPAMA
ncbi:alpha/beta fold hydrolase [Xanthobacter sediminis]